MRNEEDDLVEVSLNGPDASALEEHAVDQTDGEELDQHFDDVEDEAKHENPVRFLVGSEAVSVSRIEPSSPFVRPSNSSQESPVRLNNDFLCCSKIYLIIYFVQIDDSNNVRRYLLCIE